jgi:STE24 endopeptidase
MMWAYPAVIAPLFNKFTPLEDESLRGRIDALLERCGFKSNGIFVMDGSRRSSHGNAYFSGLGSNKRIVFFDTLLESLNADEIEAVLAHELGHFRRNHIKKRIVLMMSMSLVGLALLGWLMQQPWFYSALGITTPSVHTALALFLMVLPVFTFFLQPLMAMSMRKHEFEADDFAAEHAEAEDLIRALVKLYEENASTLTPDHLYSAFHDSHPPAPVRIAHLSSTMQAG